MSLTVRPILNSGSLTLPAAIAIACAVAARSATGGPILCLALVAAAAIAVRPALALWVAVAIESTRLLIVGQGVPSSTATAAVGGVLAYGAVLTWLRGRGDAALIPVLVLPILAVAGPGLVVLTLSSTTAHLVATTNVLVSPFLAAYIAYAATRREWQQFQRLLVILVVANALECVRQVATGTAGLVAAGLDYGTTIRQIDGVLRAPGLTLTNASAGFVGAAVVVTLVISAQIGMSIGRIWYLAGLMAGGVVIYLSTSRSAVIFVISCLIVLAVLRRDRTALSGRSSLERLLWKIGGVGFAAALPAALVSYGAGSNDSLLDRFAVWSALLNQHLSIFGLGAGRVGAASFSSTNPNPPIFTDNSWLSITIQFGVLGLVVSLLLLMIALTRSRRLYRNGARSVGSAITALIAATSVTGIFIEVLDYPLCMMLVAATAATAAARAHRTRNTTFLSLAGRSAAETEQESLSSSRTPSGRALV